MTRLKRFAVLTAGAVFIVTLALLPDTFARQRVGDSGTVVFRLNLWKAALSMAADRPLLGSGFTTFQDNLDDYRQEMTIDMPTRIADTVAHNTTLTVLVELGTIGLLLYAGVMVAVFRRARTAVARSWGREGAVWVAVFVGVFFFQIQFVVLTDPATNHIFFGMMGALAGTRFRSAAGAIPGPATSSASASCRPEHDARSSLSVR
jgi:O-antigen ligase